MIGLPAGTQVWICAGVTDMRRGFDSLAALVQTTLDENPFSGHVFVFRGRRGDLLKVLWYAGDGLCLLAKRLQGNRFVVAERGERQGTSDAGAAGNAARGHRLARTETIVLADEGSVTTTRVL